MRIFELHQIEQPLPRREHRPLGLDQQPCRQASPFSGNGANNSSPHQSFSSCAKYMRLLLYSRFSVENQKWIISYRAPAEKKSRHILGLRNEVSVKNVALGSRSRKKRDVKIARIRFKKRRERQRRQVHLNQSSESIAWIIGPKNCIPINLLSSCT